MAQAKVTVVKSCADAAALQGWFNSLATDIGNGKVIEANIVTSPGESGGIVSGHLILSAATSVSSLTVSVED